MALTQSDLDALDSAIASNELEVDMEGRRVKYRSTTELIDARRHVEGVLRTNAATTKRSSYHFNFTTSRGD